MLWVFTSDSHRLHLLDQPLAQACCRTPPEHDARMSLTTPKKTVLLVSGWTASHINSLATAGDVPAEAWGCETLVGVVELQPARRAIKTSQAAGAVAQNFCLFSVNIFFLSPLLGITL